MVSNSNTAHQRRARVGIIGAGQLARMTIYKAKQWGLNVDVYSDDPDAPAVEIANRALCGSFDDLDSLREFSRNCEIVTFDLENVHLPSLRILEDEGVVFYPRLSTLGIVQNKLLQRQLLASKHLPAPNFIDVQNTPELQTLPQGFDFPCVLKLQQGGYDGKGVKILKSKDDLATAFLGPCLIEDLVNIKMELSVVLARSAGGQTAVYEPVEMVMDSELHCLDYLISPARIDATTRKRAIELATKTAEAFDLVGVGAVELFLTEDHKLLVNEIAPRPHNSGHHTIEASFTSQFEQHLRAILNLPLGDTHLISPSVLCNILGPSDHLESDAFYDKIHDVLGLNRLQLHLYGKKDMRKGRKMGHVTVLDANIDNAITTALKARDLLHSLGDPHDN